MELARNERELMKPINWGKITFNNLKRREGTFVSLTSNEPPRKAVQDALLANPVLTGPLDASLIINSLSENDQCDFFGRYTKCTVLHIRGWLFITDSVLRCISFVFAHKLVEIDFSYSGVTAEQLEIVLVNAIKIQILKLNKCVQLDTMCMNVVAKLCNSTLRELYVNGCGRFTVEPILCIGGCS